MELLNHHDLVFLLHSLSTSAENCSLVSSCSWSLVTISSSVMEAYFSLSVWTGIGCK